MAVRHGVKDTDNHFIIDPITRTIVNQSGKLILIQYDHNSERFTFECPRYVDDHDMSLCNRVEIHYINSGSGNSKSSGVYEVDDLQVSPDGTTVTCSWLISQNATQNVGKLNFVIRFACTAEDGIIEYSWSAGIYSDITVYKSIYNGEEFIEDYVDILEMWKQDLYSEGLKIASIEQTSSSTEDNGINTIKITMTDGSTKTFQIQNGSQGPEGPIGTSISSIIRTSGNGSAGSIDTYTISMSDGTKSTFQVYNGKNGADGDGSGDMTAATYDPQGKATDIFQYVDDAVAGASVPATEDTLGVVHISDSVEKTSSNTAASSTAVKAAYDKALEALEVAENADSKPVVVDDVFYATFGTTTSAEIESACTAGKKVYCLMSNGAVCPMFERYSATSHCFYKGGHYFYCSNDAWTEADCPYEGVSNKSTSITAESTDIQYPSAKAVYDFVEASTPDIAVDTAMSDISTNLVQNKVIKAYVDRHVDSLEYMLSQSQTTVDNSVSDTSTNPVQNKVIKTYVDNLVDESKTTVDSSMSDTSTNPVQNKIVKKYIDDLVASSINSAIASAIEGGY